MQQEAKGRFGGHQRLEYGHGNPFPPMHGAHSRNHSVKMYLPARTAQVLVRDSLLQGGVKIWMDGSFLSYWSLPTCEGMKLSLQTWKDGKQETEPTSCLETKTESAGSRGAHHVPPEVGADPSQQDLPCKSSKDGFYRVFFPGDYAVSGLGYLKNGPGCPVEEAEQAEETPEASPTTVPKDEAKDAKAKEGKTGGYSAGSAVPAAAGKAVSAEVTTSAVVGA
eukprot:g10083.t1